MALSKFTIILLLASMAVMVMSKSNDLVIGSRAPGDHMIQFQQVKVPSKVLQVVTAKKSFFGNNYSRITQVRLLDQNKKGNGATAKVVNGGPGSTHISVDFKSIRGHSIDFLVELYGR